MTTNTQTLPKRLPFFPPFYRQAAVTAALARWADWLFFGHNIGITFAIFLAVLSFNLIGDALRDVIDPRLRTSGMS